MTEQEFLKFHTNYFGEDVDNVDQIVTIRFTGRDLFEYVNQALSMSGVSEWISVETPPHDQETVLLMDSYNQVSTGYFHGAKSGFIWDAPDLHDPIKWKRIIK